MNYLLVVCASSHAIIASAASYLQIGLRNKGYSHSLVGILLGICQIAAIVFPIVIGNISDKTKKKKFLLVLCGVGTLVGYNLAYLTGNIIFVIFGLIIGSGFFWAIFPLQDSLINGYLKGDSTKYSKIRSAGTAGFIVSSLVFAITKIPDETNNISITLVISVFTLAFLVIMSLLPKSIEEESLNMNVYKKEEGVKDNGKWYDSAFILMLIVIAFSRFTNSIVDRLLASYMVENLNMGSNFTLYFAWGAVCEFFCMRFAGRTITKKKVQPWVWIFIGSLMLVVRMLLYAFWPTKVGFLIAQSLHGFTFGSFHVAVINFISSHVDSKHSSKAMSYYWAGTVNLPVTVGAFLGGFIIEKYGYFILFLAYLPASVIASILCFANRKKFICK
ncbi:MAG: MFS transporter [Sphaerochaetaceae bacterium]